METWTTLNTRKAPCSPSPPGKDKRNGVDDVGALSNLGAETSALTHDDAVEFEEQDGHILDVESATIDQIIDCFWRKLLVLVLISARYGATR